MTQRVFHVEIYDLAEGLIKYKVTVYTEDEAIEEASIYAAEVGCQHVDEVIVL